VGSSSLLIGEAQYIKYLIETVGKELIKSRFELITSLVPKGGERERTSNIIWPNSVNHLPDFLII
jgi:hypothetical protein